MKTGSSTIKLRDGRTYIAEKARQTARGVAFTGRLRVTDLNGSRLYPPGQHFMTPSRIQSIEWHDDDSAT
jgi:hypothetical protein